MQPQLHLMHIPELPMQSSHLSYIYPQQWPRQLIPKLPDDNMLSPAT